VNKQKRKMPPFLSGNGGIGLVPSGLIKPLVLPGVGKKALAKRKPQCYDSEGLATASQTKQGGFTRDEK
jgi:hypothetical protein